MASLPEAYPNIQINNETETNKNIPYSLSNSSKTESISVSVSTLKTACGSQKNQIETKIKTITEKRQSLTPEKLSSNKLVLYIKKDFFMYKGKSTLNLKCLNKKNKLLGKNINIKKKCEIEKKINVTPDEIQELKKNAGLYCQSYNRNDFEDQPPAISNLFLHDYNYKNKICFSHINNTFGKINGSDKVPNVFYNHLMISNCINSKGISYCCTSVNKRYKEKLLSIVYYSP